MLGELQARVQAIAEMAKKAGANDAWVSASRSREVGYTWRDGKLEKVEDSTSRAVSLALYVDGRYGSHSTTDLREDRLASFVSDAVALTRALQPDPFRLLPDPALFAGRSSADLQLVDPEVDRITADDRLAWAKGLYESVASAPKLISASGWVSDGHSHGAAASTNGFSGTWESTSLWYGADLTVRDEGDARPEGSWYVGGGHRAGLPSVDEVGRRAVADAQSRLGAKKGPTVRTRMIVDPRASGSLLRRLIGPANGRALQQGQSMYKDRLGKKLVSELLHVTDRPLLPRGLASRHFDGEGITARDLPIFEAGVARNAFIDTYYGRKLGVAPTTGGSSNLVVGLGNQDLAALLAGAQDAVYVTSWLGGNSDGTTGDFSLGIRGHLVSGGQVGGPVGEMNVTGNLLDLFSRLVALGNDPWIYGTTLCPTLVFDDVQFSGA